MFKKFKKSKTFREVVGYFMSTCCPKLMSDRLRLEMTYLYWTNSHLNLKNPKTFNEKIQWLKLYDRNPLYTRLVDKRLVKDWVREKIGDEYVIPTLAVYTNADEIDIDKLPNQFVLKCNHDSGSVCICRDKALFDIEDAKKKLADRLNYDCSSVCGEWAYKNVPRCIIAEQYMEDIADDALMDYKWFCFGGEPKLMYMSRDKGKHPTTDFFDMDFNHLPIRMQDPNSDVLPQKPAQFEEMRRLAGVLSQGIPQVRVDFYVINNHVYFGEMTFYHLGGMTPVKPDEWNRKMGDLIILPKKRK